MPPPLLVNAGANISGDYNFRVVFKETSNKESALKSVEKLKAWHHKVVMYTSDSVTYKLAELINKPLTDTTRVKDSLRRFYGGNVSIEVK